MDNDVELGARVLQGAICLSTVCVTRTWLHSTPQVCARCEIGRGSCVFRGRRVRRWASLLDGNDVILHSSIGRGRRWELTTHSKHWWEARPTSMLSCQMSPNMDFRKCKVALRLRGLQESASLKGFVVRAHALRKA